jgi:hypothetical protein
MTIVEYLLGTHFTVACCTKDAFRWLPALWFSYSYGLWADFHGGNTGSNPVGVAKLNQQFRVERCCELFSLVTLRSR